VVGVEEGLAAGVAEGLVVGGEQAGEGLVLRGAGDETVEGAGVVTTVTAAEVGVATVGIEQGSSSSRSSGSRTHSSSSSSRTWILRTTMQMTRTMLQEAHRVLHAAEVAWEAAMAAEGPGTSCQLVQMLFLGADCVTCSFELCLDSCALFKLSRISCLLCEFRYAHGFVKCSMLATGSHCEASSSPFWLPVQPATMQSPCQLACQRWYVQSLQQSSRHACRYNQTLHVLALTEREAHATSYPVNNSSVACSVSRLLLS
jgi:hypothetical protein